MMSTARAGERMAVVVVWRESRESHGGAGGGAPHISERESPAALWRRRPPHTLPSRGFGRVLHSHVCAEPVPGVPDHCCGTGASGMQEAVQQNCEAMLDKAAAAGVYLRPHVKTHKCHQIARMQVGGDKGHGIIASTLPEIRHMAADGFTDITYGVPVTASKILPLLAICADYAATRISILIDSEEQLRDLEALCADPVAAPSIEAYRCAHSGTLFGCFLKIDVGYHRAGVDVRRDEAAAVALARRLHESKPLVFRGIYSHSGNAYNASSRAEARAISTLECKHARKFADSLAAESIPCPTISVGSTPSCGAAEKFAGASEIHPGNYVFYDRQQMAVPVCTEGQVAVRVLTSVIGHYRLSCWRRPPAACVLVRVPRSLRLAGGVASRGLPVQP